MEEQSTILIIEDSPGDARLIQEMLRERRERAELVVHDRLSEGLRAIRDRNFDIVLLDLALPDSFGMETYLSVRENAPKTPVIILTGTTDETTGIQSVQHGAQDYLIKGQFNSFLLDRAIRYAIERKHTEIVLQESEKKYRDLVENAASAIVKVDNDRNITFFNEFAERFFGYREEEVLGRSVVGTIVPLTDSSGNDMTEMIREIFDDPYRFQTNDNENITKDGRRVWLHWTNRMILDDSGESVGVLCVGSDITERKAVQETLREREEMLQAFMNAITESAFLMDTAGHVILSNRALVSAFNTTHEELLGRSIFSLLPENIAAPRKKNFDEVVRTGRPVQFEDSRNGRDLLHHLFPVSGTSGSVEIVANISMDITERKEMEMTLRRRNKQLSIINRLIRLANSSLILEEMLEIVMNMTLDLLDFDMGGVFLKNSDGAHADLIAINGLSEYYYEKNKRIRIRDYPHNLNFFGGQARYVENTPDQEPGTIDTKVLEDLGALSYASVPLMADSVVLGCLTLARSETFGFSEWEKVILESIGKEVGGTILRGMLQDKLEEANEETNLYIDIIMHDIRRANHDLLGHLEVVREMLQGPAKNYIGKLDDIVVQSNEIISNVSTLRKISNTFPTLIGVHLDATIQAAIQNFPGAHISYDKNDCAVLADDLLESLFSNLIGNSLKFGGPDVRVFVTTAQENGMVNVCVEDTGPGIPNEEKNNIFRYFQPNLERRSSRGFGLHISRLLVERYGGSIRLEDRVPGNPGAGLAVRFTLTTLPPREKKTA
jgi:two-component system sensor histidine kinase KdpD